ncbi:MAG: TonB-dependent receptor [Bacteroidales bacterium]|nr:TonB-dependent receptor [Bacteroidales bacterium]
MKRSSLFLFIIVFHVTGFAQNLVRGKIIDQETKQPIPLAQIFTNKSSTGTISDSSGFFQLKINSNKTLLTIESIGFQTKNILCRVTGNTTDLGTIYLAPKSYTLNEINITSGLANKNVDPVNVTTLSAQTIKSQLGDQPLPLSLQSVPGVFSIRDGGGSGDAKVSIRGFKQNNVGLLLNGIPINGMENGLVYWSNWLGLNDATAEIQVQQGPGLANMATDAVGGSINIITRTNNKPKGGSFSYQMTDYGNTKLTLALNTGTMKNGWNFSFLGSYFNGPGYVDATYVHGFSYFFSANKQINNRNHINVTLMGSPQHHGQRTLRLTYNEMEQYGLKYNKDWGSLNGNIMNASENFYHKPFLNINHDLTISKHQYLSNSFFVSYGNGGGKWSETFNYAPSIFQFTNSSGQIDWNEIYNLNANNQTPYVLANGDTVSGYSLRVGTNYLSTFITTGFMSTYKEKLNRNLTFTGGIYYRYLNSYVREQISNLMGGQFYIEDYGWSLSSVAGRNQIKKVGDIIKTDNNSIIQQANAYSRLIFENEKSKAYIALGANNRWYQRIDRFNYVTNQKSIMVKKIGFDLRTGLNYHVSPSSQLYFNTAYISKPPFFTYVFGNYTNIPVQNLKNEIIKTIELGYRFTKNSLNGNVTVYYTRWDNVSLLSDQYVQLANNQQSRSMINGLNSLHKGIEGTIKYNISEKFTLGALFSLGDYKWLNNVQATLLNNNNVVTDTINVYAKGLYVGGTAQQQIGLNIDTRIANTFNLKLQWMHYSKVFADFNPLTRNDAQKKLQPYEFPEYSVLNAYLSVPFKISNLPALLQINGYNLLNKKYIVSGLDGAESNLQTFTGFWSFGTNFNIMLKLYF